MATPMTAAEFKAALQAEGCNVREHDSSWAAHNRNHKGAWGPLNGVMVHHTGGLNAEDFVWSGDSDLPGPLCHAYISKAGEVVLIGWGRTNHAGGGDPDTLAAVVADQPVGHPPTKHEGSSGAVDGNAHFVGYECENKGDGKDKWPKVQVDAMVRACAAVCRHYGWSVDSVIRHMDWSDWKSDPAGIDWDWFRSAVAHQLVQGTPDGGDSGPAPDPDPQPGPSHVYPGADKFGPGADNEYVTVLGQMLVSRGGGRFYQSGPGSQWGTADLFATAEFQQAQGWTGADADGIPGPATWTLLTEVRGNDIPPAPVISAAVVADSARRDPSAPQGSAAHEDHVRPVEEALCRLGYLNPDYAVDGSFGTATVSAYAGWQRSLGYRGEAADGIPGYASLSQLGARTGLFSVTN